MLKELHDRLLEVKPEGASHDAASCPVCNGTATVEHANDISHGGSVKTYTEDEFNAVLAQVADLEAKVKELDGVRLESAAEAKIAEAQAQADAKVADLQSQLDAAVLEAQAAKQEKEATVAYLEAQQAEADRAAQVAALREERIAKVKEVASFPDEYIESRADAWAALDEEAFEAHLADWKAIGSKPAADATSEALPADTAMKASRETTTTRSGSLREVLGFRFQGVDTRAI